VDIDGNGVGLVEIARIEMARDRWRELETDGDSSRPMEVARD
jgi:hypothetical protein